MFPDSGGGYREKVSTSYNSKKEERPKERGEWQRTLPGDLVRVGEGASVKMVPSEAVFELRMFAEPVLEFGSVASLLPSGSLVAPASCWRNLGGSEGTCL